MPPVRTRRRLLILLFGLIVSVVLLAAVYQAGMAALEGKPRTFLQSLMWAGETISTTGYGKDAEWSHPFMVLFIILVQFAGVFVIFLVVPVALVPYLESRFEERIPRTASPALRDHVVIFRYGAAVETLQERLSENQIASLVVELDEDEARKLLEKGSPVVLSRTEEDVLSACNLESSRAIVANGRDEENAALILRARQAGFQRPIYALVEEPVHRKPMELAGATAVYTPRHILAAALAARASERISPRISGLQELSSQLSLREIRIHPDSPLAGKTIEQARIGADFRVTVAGQWVGGHLLTRALGSMRLEPRGILLVVGRESDLAQIEKVAHGATPLHREGPFVIAGYGEVGRKIHELLNDVDEPVRVIDRKGGPGVDLPGNVLDPGVLRDAGVAEARCVILALDSDDATLFATVIVQDCSPTAPVIARVNHARNVENIHRAGADFALSISQVSGQMLSYRLLGNRGPVVESHLRIQKVDGYMLAGRSLRDLSLPESTGCSIVAIERSSEVIAGLHADDRIEPGDSVYLCGDEAAMKRYRQVHPAA